MRILVTCGDFRQHLTPAFHYLMEEVGKLVDLTLWYQPGDINDIIRQLDNPPDFVFINEYGETNSPAITGLDQLSTPFAVSLHDLHYRIVERNEALKRDKVQHIFTIGRDKFIEWYPHFKDCWWWLPHHVNTDIFKEYGKDRRIDYLMMGAVHPIVYPLRSKILAAMQGIPGFLYHKHPGYRIFTKNDKAYVHEKYAREIGRAKIFLTCGSRWKYPLAKYYEVLACQTLLLAPVCNELGDLGFIPGIHYVPINEYDFIEKAHYYLNHEEERLAIARQGFAMVHARHSTRKRAQELVAMISAILSKH